MAILYDPKNAKNFRLSRSKLELFLKCARCFYLDRRLGIAQPPSFPFNLNSAVDELLKREFDAYRERGEPHPLLIESGIEAVPFQHERLDEWRDALRRGITFAHAPSDFVVTGGIDDIWVNAAGQVILVDYKATAKKEPVTLEAPWQISYKRQMDVYAWLFEKNGFSVSATGYFVYCNGRADRARFDRRLEFDVSVLPYRVDTTWQDTALVRAQRCLSAEHPPAAAPQCVYCAYVRRAAETLG